MIGTIHRLPLREVWKHEALDFTQWLEANIDVLNDALDLELSNAEREKAAGAFSVDLVAEDSHGNPVVIENQLEKSDHDHLGKVITYLTAIGAKTAIWIVSEPRPEHVAAVSWLNESSAAAFYLLKLEAIRIGDSAPAPLLTLIVGPSEEARGVGKKKKEIAERNIIRRKFWTQLLARAKGKTKLHSTISPGEYSWLGTSAGLGGLNYNYTVTKADAKVELYIDGGKEADAWNAKTFDQLAAARATIEEEFGGSLHWDKIDGRRACRISKRVSLGGYRSAEEQWPAIHEALIDGMIMLDAALSPYIKTLG